MLNERDDRFLVDTEQDFSEMSAATKLVGVRQIWREVKSNMKPHAYNSTSCQREYNHRCVMNYTSVATTEFQCNVFAVEQCSHRPVRLTATIWSINHFNLYMAMFSTLCIQHKLFLMWSYQHWTLLKVGNTCVSSAYVIIKKTLKSMQLVVIVAILVDCSYMRTAMRQYFIAVTSVGLTATSA